MDEEICRICHGPQTVDDLLYHSCKCSGSIKYVHQDCLIEWLSAARVGDKCEICGVEYSKVKTFAEDTPQYVRVSDFMKKIPKIGSLVLRYAYILTRAYVMVIIISWSYGYALTNYSNSIRTRSIRDVLAFDLYLKSITGGSEHSILPFLDNYVEYIVPKQLLQFTINGFVALIITLLLFLFILTLYTNMMQLNMVQAEIILIRNGVEAAIDRGDYDIVREINMNINANHNNSNRENETQSRQTEKDNTRYFSDEELISLVNYVYDMDTEIEMDSVTDNTSTQNSDSFHDAHKVQLGKIMVLSPLSHNRLKLLIRNYGLDGESIPVIKKLYDLCYAGNSDPIDIFTDATIDADLVEVDQTSNELMDIQEPEDEGDDLMNLLVWPFLEALFAADLASTLLMAALIAVSLTCYPFFAYFFPTYVMTSLAPLHKLMVKELLLRSSQLLSFAGTHIPTMIPYLRSIFIIAASYLQHLSFKIVEYSFVPQTLTQNLFYLAFLGLFVFFEFRCTVLFCMKSLLSSETGKKVVERTFCAFLMLKVFIMLYIEMICFPIVCGLIVHLTALPLFPPEYPLSWHFGLLQKYMYRMLIMEWFLGMIFVRLTLKLVMTLGKLWRDEVLYFISASNIVELIKLIISTPISKQIYNAGISALMHGLIVVLTFGTFNLISAYIFRVTLRIDDWSILTFVKFWPVIVFWKLFTVTLKKAEDEHTVSSETTIAEDSLAEAGIDESLNSENMPQESDDVDENQKSGSLKNILFLWVGDRLWLYVTSMLAIPLDLSSFFFNQPKVLSHKELRSLANRELDNGYFVRAPATDKFFRGQKTNLFVPVDQFNTRLDGKIGHFKNELDKYVVVWFPKHFRYRLVCFLFGLWSLFFCTLCLFVLVPLLVGRLSERLFFNKTIDNDVLIYVASVIVCSPFMAYYLSVNPPLYLSTSKRYQNYKGTIPLPSFSKSNLQKYVLLNVWLISLQLVTKSLDCFIYPMSGNQLVNGYLNLALANIASLFYFTWGGSAMFLVKMYVLSLVFVNGITKDLVLRLFTLCACLTIAKLVLDPSLLEKINHKMKVFVYPQNVFIRNYTSDETMVLETQKEN